MKKDEALYILETYLTEEQLSRLKRVADMTGAGAATIRPLLSTRRNL
jgi:hypothetical protein